MPFTNNREFKREPRMFVKASGMYYWSQHGNKILDGSSGLFTTAAGHCRPEIAKAVGSTSDDGFFAVVPARPSGCV